MELQNENWKPIDGFPDYEVSDLGRVRSFKKGKVRILKHSISTCGYRKFNLFYNGVGVSKKASRLAMTAFSGKSDLHIDHINGNKLDDRIINLRYCSQRENTTYYHLASETSSKYTGIYWYKAKRKWRAKIKINKIDVHLGYFDNELTASQAYQNALKIHNAGGKVLSIREQKKEDKLHLDYAEYTTKEYNKELDLRYKDLEKHL